MFWGVFNLRTVARGSPDTKLQTKM